MKTVNKLENGRADFAYRCAEDGAGLGKAKAKEYRSYVKKIPMLIKTNGLGATLAFVFSKSKRKDSDKGDEAYKKIYEQVKEWYEREENPYAEWFKKDEYKNKELAEIVCEMGSQEYRAITKETLAFFNWLRRFAEGLIDEDG